MVCVKFGKALVKHGCRVSPLIIVLAATLVLSGHGARAQQCTNVGTNQTCTNSIFLSGGANGVFDTATLTVINTGTGTIEGSTFGVNAADTAEVTNFGTITGGVFGINANKAADV